MKKWFFLLAFSAPLVFGACKKSSTSACTVVESTATATAIEVDSIRSYLNINSLVATQHECGAFYTIDSAGTGANPGLCSAVVVTYSGYLFNSTVPFESYLDSAGITYTLTDLIAGWQRVMPLLKVGGGITIYIPPSLGYGSVDKKNANGDIIIPKNSYLKFNIHLINVY